MEPLGSHAATVIAGKQVDWIHNRRGVTNRSRFQRKVGGIGLLPTQFKYFSVEYLQQMKRVYETGYAQAKTAGFTDQAAALKAAKPVAKSMGWLFAFAGAMGLPFLSGLIDMAALLWNEFFGPMIRGTKFRPIRTVGMWLDDSMKEHGVPRWARNLVLRGILSGLYISMEKSLGLGDQFSVRRGDEKYKTVVDLLAGASGTTVQQGFKFGKKLTEGDYLGAAFSFPGVPKGPRQAGEAWRESKLYPGSRIEKTPTERVKSALGFTPLRVGEARGEITAQNWALANAAERDRYFARALADATHDRVEAQKKGDTKAEDKAIARFQEILSDRAAYNRDMLEQGRMEEVSKGTAIRPAIRRELGTTRKNLRLEDRLNR